MEQSQQRGLLEPMATVLGEGGDYTLDSCDKLLVYCKKNKKNKQQQPHTRVCGRSRNLLLPVHKLSPLAKGCGVQSLTLRFRIPHHLQVCAIAGGPKKKKKRIKGGGKKACHNLRSKFVSLI